MRISTNCLFSLLIGGLALLPSACQGQCSDSSTVVYAINSVSRTASNNVEAILGTQVVGDYSDYWNVYVSATETVAGTLLHSGSDTESGGSDVPGASGTAAGFYWNDAPSNAGSGNYQTASFHEAASNCGEQSQDLQGSLVETLTVSKPTISGIPAEWYLGLTGQNQFRYANQNR